MKKVIALSIIFFAVKAFAQPDSAAAPFTVSGYLETYYAYDFGRPENHNRPSFIYSFNRHNEINLNLGLIKGTYKVDKVRANIALMAGTYANANLAAEPGVLKNIYEANVGVKLSNKRDIWIDAGIFPSHIGFESAIGKDCWNLTRSILADNSPYYEAGAKISYNSKNGKWFLTGLLLNGWQRIQRVDGNNTPSFGHQVTFKPTSKITLNSSSFIGNDKPDSVKQMRYFHNFYGQFQVSDKFGITAGFDIGAEQKAKGSEQYNSWYSPVVIVKLSPNAKNNIAARVEYYSDEDGVIIPTGTTNGFRTWGYSLNYDYLIRDNIMWRIEGRGFTGKDKTFIEEGDAVNSNFFITSSLAISF